MSYETITPNELYSKIEGGAQPQLIDVRTPAEFREIHPSIAKNCPLDSLGGNRVPDLDAAKNGEPVYVICRSGNRSKMACDKLIKTGINVVNVEGGVAAWEQAGLPVERGQKAMSLERQVRIAAGSLVLLGVVLAVATGIPWFLGISAFVGAGLVFAGVTDTCGMGMLLARMPWNRVQGEAACVGTCEV